MGRKDVEMELAARQKTFRMAGIFLIALIVLNTIFFAFRLINVLLYWVIIIIIALIAFIVLPRLRKKLL